MKTFALTATALLLVSGCGGSKTPVAPLGHTTPPTVVFIGDSITAIWGSGQEGPQFAEHPTWIAKGISGQNSNQLPARFQTDVVDLHPDIVHILIGANDVYPGWMLGPCDVPVGSSNVIDSPANVTAMVQMAQAADIKVILATIPPWETAPITVGDIAYDADPSVGRYALIDIWNAWLRQYASGNNIPLADYHTALEASNSENYITALTLDGVHPSVQGHVVMTPLAEEAITSATKVPVVPSVLVQPIDCRVRQDSDPFGVSEGELSGQRILQVRFQELNAPTVTRQERHGDHARTLRAHLPATPDDSLRRTAAVVVNSATGH